MPLLPKPYPDEVIGSVIERACFQSGVPMKRMTQALFGRTRSCSSFLMASKLSDLACYTGLDAEELLLQHTMYPYAVAFIPKRQQARLKQKMLSLRSNECIGSLTRNISHGVAYRRTCPVCVSEDLRQYGESYWRRSHLLPAVLNCATHRVPLTETSTRLRNAVQTRSIALVEDAVRVHHVLHVESQVLHAVRDTALAALRSEIQPQDDWATVYKDMAQRKGYGMKDGDIATKRFSADLIQYFGPQLLESAGCSIKISARQPWPALMVRDSIPQNYAPAKHVFYQAFCTAGGQAPSEFGYQSQGIRAVDTLAVDEVASTTIAKFLKSHAATARRFTVREVLDAAGIFQAFRHAREKYPLVQAQIALFRRSNQSARQLGLRPYWRKRLRSRLPPEIAIGVRSTALD
jgi:hypothetical protein